MMDDCGGGGDDGGKINSDTTHRHGHCCQQSLLFIVTGRAAHGRIGRIFQNLIREEEVAAEEVEAVDVAVAHDICRRSYWMDKSPYAYAAPTDVDANANANDVCVNNNTNNHNNNYTDGEGHQHTPATTTTTNNDHHDRLAFLWENAPQYNTRTLRDTVSCYSHLPFGILLDDKWALARLLGSGSRRNCADDGGVGGDDDNDDAFNNPHLATLESHCFRGAEFVKFAKRVGLFLPSTATTATTTTTTTTTNTVEVKVEVKVKVEV